MVNVLLSPLAYLTIKHEAKLRADWAYPVLISFLCTVLIFWLGRPGSVSGQEGLLSKLLMVSSVLPGFYIAALAAIATFNRPDIDELMPEPTPKMTVKLRGKDNEIRLTRRRFLSHLFAFLCLESLVLMIVCVFSGIIAKGAVALFSALAAHVATMIFVFLLLIVFWQMVCVTCLGLYYLGDRLHRPAN